MTVTARARPARPTLAYPRTATRPASKGDSPMIVTPMDITPEDASWADLQVREKDKLGLQDGEEGQLAEIQLDEALEMTFPASDPTAELPVAVKAGETDAVEILLDLAIEMSFPASDPVSITSPHESKVK